MSFERSNTARDAFQAAHGHWRREVREAGVRLSNEKASQKTAFERLAPDFLSLYESFGRPSFEPCLVTSWKRKHDGLERELLPVPPFSFLRGREISSTMFHRFEPDQLAARLDYLHARLSAAEFADLAMEDYAGDPPMSIPSLLSSHQHIHLLYLILRFFESSACDAGRVRSVVEWGGGYGKMAALFWRLVPTRPTYVIIDLPLMCCLQRLYLSSVLGEENVHLLSGEGDRIAEGRVNLVPLALAERVDIAPPDIFAACFSLDECPRWLQERVERRNWFGAEHLLLCYNIPKIWFPAATHFAAMAERAGARRERRKWQGQPDEFIFAFR